MKLIKALIQKRVGEIARSLIDEGYRAMVNCPLPASYFVKLRHKENRNVITILGNYEQRKVKLIKNGRTIKEEDI